ncbi:MAG: DUF4124 domain-containing protein [Cycloclasticus sp.]
MYRAFILFCCSLACTVSLADMRIYKWVDAQGNTHFSQQPPRNKNITPQRIIIKTDYKEGLSLKALIDSANEIAKSNAERKAANDKVRQNADKQRLAQERCETSKKNLAELDYGGNRLYKDADGNYSRFSAKDKTQQREKLNAFINENCR